MYYIYYNLQFFYILESALKQLCNLTGWLKNHFTDLKNLTLQSIEILKKFENDDEIPRTEKPFYNSLRKLCEKIVQTEVSQDKPAPKTGVDNGNQTTQPPLPTGNRGDTILHIDRNNLNNGEEDTNVEISLSRIQTILTSCEQKVKTYLRESETGRLVFDDIAKYVNGFKSAEYEKLITISNKKKEPIALVKDNMKALRSKTGIHKEELQLNELKTKVKKHKQALTYITEIGKWCERIKNKTEWILPNDNKLETGKGKLLAVFSKTQIVVNRLDSYKKSHKINNSKSQMPKHRKQPL